MIILFLWYFLLTFINEPIKLFAICFFSLDGQFDDQISYKYHSTDDVILIIIFYKLGTDINIY